MEILDTDFYKFKCSFCPNEIELEKDIPTLEINGQVALACPYCFNDVKKIVRGKSLEKISEILNVPNIKTINFEHYHPRHWKIEHKLQKAEKTKSKICDCCGKPIYQRDLDKLLFKPKVDKEVRKIIKDMELDLCFNCYDITIILARKCKEPEEFIQKINVIYENPPKLEED